MFWMRMGAKVAKARAALVKAGVYGLVSAERLDDAKHLPYTENLVNEVAVHALGQMPLAEVFRVLVPRGFVSASPRTGVTVAQLKAAGFEASCAREEWLAHRAQALAEEYGFVDPFAARGKRQCGFAGHRGGTARTRALGGGGDGRGGGFGER